MDQLEEIPTSEEQTRGAPGRRNATPISSDGYPKEQRCPQMWKLTAGGMSYHKNEDTICTRFRVIQIYTCFTKNNSKKQNKQNTAQDVKGLFSLQLISRAWLEHCAEIN